MIKGDLLITNGQIFNTYRRQFFNGAVLIKDGIIQRIYKEEIPVGVEADEILNAEGKHIIPGLIDIHLHVESSMVTPKRFSDEVLRHGTTTIVADAHEIANVAGVEGLKEFMNQKTDLDIFHAIPSSVPSTNEQVETTGGKIGVEEVKELLTYPQVIALGEVMNYAGTVSQEMTLTRQMIQTVKNQPHQLPIEGHIPKVGGEDLQAFISRGITSDHTHQFPNNMVEKIEAGLFIQLQEKSITDEVIAVLNDHRFHDYACFITDDIMPDDLRKGHLNYVAQLGVRHGLSVEDSIYMSSFTPARYMNLRDRGSLDVGKVADFIVLENLNTLTPQEVYKKGKPVSELTKNYQPSTFSSSLSDSLWVEPLSLEDLRIKVADKKVTSALVTVISISPVGTFTKEKSVTLPVEDGEIQWQDSDLALMVVQERYGKNGSIAYGFIENTIQLPGAVATTWAHDHHNVMTLGTDIDSMLKLNHALIELGGGIGVYQKNTQQLNSCPLPIGGIMSDKPVKEVGSQVQKVRQGMKDLGYDHANEIMSFATLSLPVSPALKITDQGLFDTYTQEKVPLIKELYYD